jgi:lipopolysaccharide transport system ATP-binding protein
MTTAISVHGLGKKYLLSHRAREQYTTLRDVMVRGAKRVASRLRHPFGSNLGAAEQEIFWALKDVSFEVQAGERVGIIGRNGAGKSTLLKILSRITEPSNGRFEITGRPATLLEVGTGFHPELTGRENVFLNGAILGMGRAEIRRKFDEIVAFADVEKFLDTPVKRYSSGMYVRLAFAVAAHLDPDLLIVDEVLAVGDAQFQRKCLSRMQEIGEQGRTVLFVSHNMAMISNLCQKGIVLDAGGLAFEGQISEAVLHYYRASAGGESSESSRRPEGDSVALLGGELIGTSDTLDLTVHDPLVIRMRYRIKCSSTARFVPNFHVIAPNGSYAFVTSAQGVEVMPPGDYVAECRVPPDLFNEGAYFVGLAVTRYDGDRTYAVEFFERNALTFNVIDPMDERSNRYGYLGPIPGIVRPRLDWTIRPQSSKGAA